MTSQAFLDELNKLLRKLPSHDRREILYDYEEHIRIATEQGKNENELLQGLGDPKTVAKAIMAEHYIGLADKTKSPRSIFQAIVANVSLGFFNFLIVFPPSVALLAAFFSIYIASWMLIISPVAGVYCLIQGYGITIIFASLITSGIGIFLLVAVTWILTNR